MKYQITHPVVNCNTNLFGVRFIDGKAEIDSANTSFVEKEAGESIEDILKTFKLNGCQVSEESADEIENIPSESADEIENIPSESQQEEVEEVTDEEAKG